jgi:hypothetical protein
MGVPVQLRPERFIIAFFNPTLNLALFTAVLLPQQVQLANIAASLACVEIDFGLFGFV